MSEPEGTPVSNNNNNDINENKKDLPINFKPPEKRKAYKLKKRYWENLQIRKLLKDGYSESAVREKLGMSWGHFWNRMNEIRAEDNEVLINQLRNQGGNSMLVTDIKRLDERMGDAIRHMDEIIADPKANHWVKIEAQRLRMEVALAQLKLKVEGPRLLDEVLKPIAMLAEGKITPTQAFVELPKLNKMTENEVKEYRQALEEAANRAVKGEKKPWVDKAQAEKEKQDSVGVEQKAA